MRELQQQYLRGKEILESVANADDHSIKTQLLRLVWETESLERLREMVSSFEDAGIKLTFKRAD